MLSSMQVNNEECAEAIYSEDYVALLVDYVGSIEEIVQRFRPICYQILTVQQAIIYVSLPNQQALAEAGFNYRNIPKCFGLLDTSALEETGVLRLRRQPYLDLYGQGVLIGFIDTGIEYTHPVFVNADNTTRILSIWDQTIRTGEPPEGLLYGTEYSRTQINQALASDNPLDVVPSTDTNGHGTFMAGAAAGNILERDDFSGIATSADIVVVKLKTAKQKIRDYFLVNDNPDCYTEDDIMSGIRYLVDVSSKVKKPIVICIGVGSNSGDHNGNSPLCKLINFLGSFNGTVFSVAGGNEGNRGHHYESRLVPQGAMEEVEINVGEGDKGFSMELWADTLGIFSIGMVSPSGQIIERIQPRIGKTETIRFLLEKTVATIEYYIIEPESGDELVVFRFLEPAQGVWKIRVYNDTVIQSRFNIWLPMEQLINQKTVFNQPEPNITICEPGNAAASVTSSNYNHKTESIYIYSSRGYTRGGLVKPTIASPGVDVFGPLLRGRFGTKTGSSVSASITAGICALLLEWGIVLQNDLELDSIEIQRYLIIGATRRELAYPNTEWGYGEINIYNIFEQLRSS